MPEDCDDLPLSLLLWLRRERWFLDVPEPDPH
jgi:hypothetical protein